MKKLFYILLGVVIAIPLVIIFYKSNTLPTEKKLSGGEILLERLHASAEKKKNDIKTYLSGVAQIRCKGNDGSGSLWRLDDGKYAILTNYHVIENPTPSPEGSFCYVWVRNEDDEAEGVFQVFTKDNYFIDNDQDVALLPLKPVHSIEGLDTTSTQIENMNYSISTLSNCPTKTPIGSPVYIIGYPGSGSIQIEYKPGRVATQDFRILTEGIISGYDTSIVNAAGDSNYPDFFTSAKLDSGNSGGIALSRVDESLCVLGVPTAVNVGEYDNQGMIQNINSIDI